MGCVVFTRSVPWLQKENAPKTFTYSDIQGVDVEQDDPLSLWPRWRTFSVKKN